MADEDDVRTVQCYTILPPIEQKEDVPRFLVTCRARDSTGIVPKVGVGREKTPLYLVLPQKQHHHGTAVYCMMKPKEKDAQIVAGCRQVVCAVYIAVQEPA